MSWPWWEACCTKRESTYEVQDDVESTIQVLTRQRRLHNPLSDLTILLLNYNPHNSYNKFYKTGKQLGHGTFGTVYLSTSLLTGEKRSVKILKKSELDMKDVETEIEAIMLLDHPNIVKFHEYFEDRRSVYLVIELCDGGDFTELFDPESRQELPELFNDVLLGIAYCHSRDIVHRDLKFGNCLLCSGSLRRTAKVIDFGLAAIKHDPESQDEWVVDNVGSALFAAPEVFCSNKGSHYGPNCDLWSVGVMLYCLLTNEHPFVVAIENVPRVKFYRQVLSGMYREAPLRRVNASQDLCQFLSHCLVKDPHRRIDAQAALDKEPWLQQTQQSESNARKAAFAVCGRQNSARFASKLTSYEEAPRFDKVVMTITSHISKAADIEDMRLSFTALDVHGHGFLLKEDIKRGLLNCGERISNHDAQALLRAIDNHADHKINYDEWLSAVMNPHDIEREASMKELFHYFDFNGSGKVSFSEVSKVVGPEEAARVFSQSPRAEEREFNFEDFKRLLHQVARNRLKAEEVAESNVKK